jgi:hypothetical protein
MREAYAARAARAYVAMQHRFQARGGGYRRDEGLHLPGAAAHLWPFARALVATLDLAGIGGGLIEGIDVEAGIADRLRALERYWDPGHPPPAYSSDVLGSRVGGDRYYDDNAWVGLGLAQLERLRPGSGYLDRAEELFRFAVSGWSRDLEPSPGGVFWVEQGRGTGRENHDRNTVSTAPNAALGLHVAELRRAAEDDPDVSESAEGSVVPREMYDWVLAALDASSGSDEPATGLFWDKVRGDGTIDRALWSYNQGNMVGLNVLLARFDAPARAGYLRRAAAIARKSLRHYAGAYERQPAAFNAIFFRNLLLLHAATDDDDLRREIVEAIKDYVDRGWDEWRDRRGLFYVPNGGVTLLNQSAMVQLLALLAWDPCEYVRIA